MKSSLLNTSSNNIIIIVIEIVIIIIISWLGKAVKLMVRTVACVHEAYQSLVRQRGTVCRRKSRQHHWHSDSSLAGWKLKCFYVATTRQHSRRNLYYKIEWNIILYPVTELKWTVCVTGQNLRSRIRKLLMQCNIDNISYQLIIIIIIVMNDICSSEHVVVSRSKRPPGLLFTFNNASDYRTNRLYRTGLRGPI